MGSASTGGGPSTIVHTIFQLVLLLGVIGGIVVEPIAMPLYRRGYYARYGRIRGCWFDIISKLWAISQGTVRGINRCDLLKCGMT